MTTNPLVTFREKLALTPPELAHKCLLSVVIINLQEKGIPHHLHPRFLRAFPETVGLIPGYQHFRTLRRKEAFPFGTSVVPETGPEFAGWLRNIDLLPEEFSERACLPMVDINFALHHWRLPSTVTHFFQEVNFV